MSATLLTFKLLKEFTCLLLLLGFVYLLGGAWGRVSKAEDIQADIEKTGHFIQGGKLYRAEEVRR